VSTLDVGDRVNLRYKIYNPDGVLTDATAVLTVTDPTGDVTTPSVTNTSTGVRDASFTLTEAGLWRWVWTISGAVIAVEYGDVLAASPAPPLYATVETLKLSLAGRAAGSTTTLAMDTARDELVALDLAAASRAIDDHCGRYFYADTAASARRFSVYGRTRRDRSGRCRLLIDDVASSTGLIVETGDGTTWTAITDYRTEPLNAIAGRRPITALARAGTWGGDEVRVTAVWGWPAVPDAVVKATLIQAARLYRRKDSPEGVVGSAEWGTIRVSRVDPDVQALLAPYVIPGIG
jgi:hypothetical protein